MTTNYFDILKGLGEEKLNEWSSYSSFLKEAGINDIEYQAAKQIITYFERSLVGIKEELQPANLAMLELAYLEAANNGYRGISLSYFYNEKSEGGAVTPTDMLKITDRDLFSEYKEDDFDSGNFFEWENLLYTYCSLFPSVSAFSAMFQRIVYYYIKQLQDKYILDKYNWTSKNNETSELRLLFSLISEPKKQICVVFDYNTILTIDRHLKEMGLV